MKAKIDGIEFEGTAAEITSLAIALKQVMKTTPAPVQKKLDDVVTVTHHKAEKKQHRHKSRRPMANKHWNKKEQSELILKMKAGLPVKQIARELGRSVGGVHQRIHALKHNRGLEA